MSAQRPSYSDFVGKLEGDRIRFNEQMNRFIDELLLEIKILEDRVKALENP